MLGSTLFRNGIHCTLYAQSVVLRGSVHEQTDQCGEWPTNKWNVSCVLWVFGKASEKCDSYSKPAHICPSCVHVDAQHCVLPAPFGAGVCTCASCNGHCAEFYAQCFENLWAVTHGDAIPHQNIKNIFRDYGANISVLNVASKCTTLARKVVLEDPTSNAKVVKSGLLLVLPIAQPYYSYAIQHIVRLFFRTQISDPVGLRSETRPGDVSSLRLFLGLTFKSGKRWGIWMPPSWNW